MTEQVSVNLKVLKLYKVFSDHGRMILKISGRREFRNTQNVEINTLLNSQWVREEIIREIRIYFEVNENKNVAY